jgi:signal transduction histidine kinase
LRRALCTIIENAIKFTPQGGRIMLRASHFDDRVCVEIEDTGRGIREEDLPRIFDKFYRGRAADESMTAKPYEPEVPGAGLGLNLARALVGGMNGSIEAKSRLGRGSKFIVKLPVWEEKI